MGDSQVTMVVSILQWSEAIAWRHALALLSTGVPDAVMQGSRGKWSIYRCVSQL